MRNVRAIGGFLALSLGIISVCGSPADEESAGPRESAGARVDPANTTAPPGPDPNALLEWAFLFVMSYNNNLAHCTEPITRDLWAGLRTGRAAAAILSDRPGPGGLVYVELRHDAREVTTLDADDITDPDVERPR